MPLKKNNYTSVLALLIVVCIIGVLKFSHPQRNIFAWDNFGYYLYLPSLFINGDLGLEDISKVEAIIEKYESTATFYQAFKGPDGNWVMRYSAGMAWLMMPFFFIGHFFAQALSYPTDGYSAPYQWAIIVEGLLFFFLAMFMIRKILLKYFNDTVTAISLIIVGLGTNVFFFSSLGNDIPHIYVFTLYTLIIWFTIRWHEDRRLIHAILLGYFLGLTMLVRPSEFVAFLIPLLWGIKDKESLRWKWQLLLKHWKHVLALAFFVFLGGLPQLVYWKIYTGDFIFNSYTNPGEGFDVLTPHIYRSIFSFRKGMLVYCPMVFFAIAGFVVMYKKQRELFWAFFVYFIINAYMLSAWTSIYNFGWRAFVQSYAVLSVPWAFFIDSLFRKKLSYKIILSLLMAFVIFYNIFQAAQIQKGVIDGSRMSPEYFLRTFMKLKASEEDRKLLLVKRSASGIDTFSNPEDYQSPRVLQYLDFENKKENYASRMDTAVAHSGLHSLKMDSSYIYSPGLNLAYRLITNKKHAWIRASVRVYPTSPVEQNDAILVVTFNHKGQPYKYRTVHLSRQDYIMNEWNELSIDYLTPEVRTKKDKISVYVWYRGKQNIWIDDLKVNVYEPL